MDNNISALLLQMRADASFTDLVDSIMNGQCVLFTGSGFSSGARNILDESMPTAWELKCILEKECGLTAESLEQAADDYLDVLGEESLAKLLKNTFTVKSAADTHIEAAANKWKRIYTTNYDDVIEWSSRHNGKILTPVTPLFDAETCSDKADIVIHINGSVHNITNTSLTEELKLSGRSYNQDAFRNSVWGRLFRFDLKDADAVFFVGYSLDYDLDLRRIVNDGCISNKIHFITAPNESDARVRNLSRYGTVHKIGAQAFFTYVKERRLKCARKPITIERPLLCFKKHSIATNRPYIKDSDITSLLLHGQVNQAMVRFSSDDNAYTGGYHYYIPRSEAMHQLDNLLDKGIKNILVHGDLGNGKTLFLEAAKSHLVLKGYEVYSFVRYDFSLPREVEQITRSGRDNVIIIIENYGHNSDVLEVLSCHRTNQIVIVSERSGVHDLRGDILEETLHATFSEIDINQLQHDSRDILIHLLDHTGLWGRKASLRYTNKEEYITRNCRNCIRDVLIGVLESPDIIMRFSNILNTIKDRKDFYETLILLMLNNMFNLNLNLDMIETAIDSTIYNNSRFRRSEVIKELVDFDNDSLKMRSSILSQVLLNNVVDRTVIKDVLVCAFKNFDKFRHLPDYKRLLSTLILYTGLRRVLDDGQPEKSYRRIMTSFFEQIRDTKFCKDNPHYWLQYAILKIDEADLILAEQYFQTSYSLARCRPGYDTYQIDNHYARYLLEKGKILDSTEPYMEYFMRAHQILTDPSHKKDTKYYPFKMAREYGPFYNAHAAHMTPQQRLYVGQASNEILGMLDSYVQRVPEHRTNPNVIMAKTVLSKLVNQIFK